MTKTISIKTGSRTEFLDITPEVQDTVNESGIKNGICYVYNPHTTAGITVNEGADPSVSKDIQKTLSRLIPHNGGYSHIEGNSDAHIKASLIGASETIIIDRGKLLLGTWQAIFFCEFDGPRSRRVLIKIIKESS
jgi:secondary thiamine-phosphate synthase enzyme